MTNKELIDVLSKYPANARIYVNKDDQKNTLDIFYIEYSEDAINSRTKSFINFISFNADK